eukprot:COSAG02_NODE_35886_length_462_cov_0.705234_1_plen_79_part_10
MYIQIGDPDRAARYEVPTGRAVCAPATHPASQGLQGDDARPPQSATGYLAGKLRQKNGAGHSATSTTYDYGAAAVANAL